MSQAKWCDFGQHAMSALEKGIRTITIAGEDKYGERVTLSWEACSKHVPGAFPAINGVIEESNESITK